MDCSVGIRAVDTAMAASGCVCLTAAFPLDIRWILSATAAAELLSNLGLLAPRCESQGEQLGGANGGPAV